MPMLVGISLLVLSAFASWGLWLGEVCWVKGWAGLGWLDGFNWSSLPICAVIVVTSSYFVAPDAAWRPRTKFVVFGFALTIGAFVTGRWAIFELFMGALPGAEDYRPIVTLVATGLAVSGGLAAAASRWLASLHIWTMVVVVVALLLVLPLSFVTVTELPALNGSTDEVHAIKMGYPVFWTAVIVPAALRLGRRRAAISSSEVA